MEKIYTDLEWKGPGYYREYRNYSTDKTHYMSLQRVCDLDDYETEARMRTKFKLYRATNVSDLPEVK